MAVNKVISDGKLTNGEYELCRDLFKLANGRLIFAKTLDGAKVYTHSLLLTSAGSWT
jgi:hypothetical protein